MNALTRWLYRRVKRTLGLLVRDETRRETLTFLAAHTAGAALAHLRGGLRRVGPERMR